MDFTRLTKRLDPKLKAIAYRLNRPQPALGAEDLYQEALIHLWQAASAGTLDDKTDSYILQGCYFHLKNYLRTHRQKLRTVSIEENAENEDGPGLFALAVRDERADAFFDRLNDRMLIDVIRNNGLTEREKRLLPFFADGLTVREIGRRMGVSHVAVLKMRDTIRLKCLKHLDIP